MKYLKYGEQKQLGTANLDEIEIIGNSNDEVFLILFLSNFFIFMKHYRDLITDKILINLENC